MTPDDLSPNFKLFSLEEPQSVRKIAMLLRTAGISGLMSKPLPRQARDPELVEWAGGFVSARMNSRQRQRHRDTERQADAKTNPSVKNALGKLPHRIGCGIHRSEVVQGEIAGY
jgi:hypothetical protein